MPLKSFRNKRITEELFKKKLEEQEHKCKICRIKDIEIQSRTKTTNRSVRMKTLVIDHEHQSGIVRGLLCPSCNSMLGFARDDIQILEAGVLYLSEFESRKLLLRDYTKSLNRVSTKKINKLQKDKKKQDVVNRQLDHVNSMCSKHVLCWLKSGLLKPVEADDCLKFLGVGQKRHQWIAKILK